MTTTQRIRAQRVERARQEIAAQTVGYSDLTEAEIAALTAAGEMELSDDELAMLDPEMRALLNAKPMGNARPAPKS